MIREWTEQHYDFSGYVTGFDPSDLGAREALRDELGYGPDEKVCIVTVGGSGVGESLLRRVIEAHQRRSAPCPSADDRGRRPADRSDSLAVLDGSRSGPTSTTSTAIWPRAIWRWLRAG